MKQIELYNIDHETVDYATESYNKRFIKGCLYLIVNNDTREGYIAYIDSLFYGAMKSDVSRSVIVGIAIDAIKYGIIDVLYFAGDMEAEVYEFKDGDEKKIPAENMTHFLESKEVKSVLKEIDKNWSGVDVFSYNDFYQKGLEKLPTADTATQKRVKKEREEEKRKIMEKEENDKRARNEVKNMVICLIEQNHFADAQALCEALGQSQLFQRILSEKYSYPL